MDLKEFIKETIGSIVEASRELQIKYKNEGVVVNPPVSVTERDLFDEGSTRHTYRRVENINFDVAITANTETTGGGKASLKIFSIEAGAQGELSKSNENVSRVNFSIPITLSASSEETTNKNKREREDEETTEELKQAEDNWQPRNVV